MAKTKTTTPATTGNNLPAKQDTKAQQMPLAEGWYSGTIIDLDDSYQTATTGRDAVKFAISVTGSRRYKGRTLSFIVTDELTNANRQDGSSKRQDLIDRFGVDVFEDPDFYLDLAVRFHIMEGKPDDKGVTRLGIASVYPQVVKEAAE